MSDVIKIFPNSDICYTVFGTFVNCDIDIWIKFASYLKKDEIDFLEKNKDLDLDSISDKDLDNLYKIIKLKKISSLMLKYKNKNCNKDEHDAVLEFMKKHPLEEFVVSRLTEEEYHHATDFVKSMSPEELKSFIELNKDNYDSMDVYFAFILFEAKEELNKIEQMDSTEESLKREKQDAVRLHRRLIKDFGDF